MKAAVIAGFEAAYLMKDQVSQELGGGLLERMLGDWCEPFPDRHLYYPSRRQPTLASTLFVEALRARAG